MKKIFFFFASFILILKSFSQNDTLIDESCNHKFKSAVEYVLYKEEITANFFNEIKNSLKNCNDSIVNKDYINHLITLRKSTNKDSLQQAFNFIKKTAMQNPKNKDFLYALGDCYRLGKGCTQDFNSAFNFLTQSSQLKNKYAESIVGYFYLKGLGVTQNYNTAYDLFTNNGLKISNHWLAYCKFFGYGTVQNKDEALIDFLDTNLEISSSFQKTLAKDTLLRINVTEEFKLEEVNDYPLDFANISDMEFESYLYELDWSESFILRKIPIEYKINLNTSEVIFTIENKEYKARFSFDSNNKIESDGSLELVNLYEDNLLKYDLKNLSTRKAIINGENLFITHIETFIPELNEPGPKWIIKSLVKEIFRHDSYDENISLYPNPISSQFTVQIHTNQKRTALIELYNSEGLKIKTLLQEQELSHIGENILEFEANDLKTGQYIIRFTIDDKEIFKNIIKQ